MVNTFIQVSTATSGTVNIQNSQQDVYLFHDAAALVIEFVMPANPIDGQRVGVSTSGGITALTLTPVVGSIVSIITALVVGTPKAWVYSSKQNKWFPVT